RDDACMDEIGIRRGGMEHVGKLEIVRELRLARDLGVSVIAPAFGFQLRHQRAPFFALSFNATSTAASVGSTALGNSMPRIAASTSFKPWPVMSRTICSLRASRFDPRNFFNAATTAEEAGSANTPVFAASVRWPSRISSSLTVMEKPLLSRIALRAMCAFEGIETEMESAIVSGCAAFS